MDKHSFAIAGNHIADEVVDAHLVARLRIGARIAFAQVGGWVLLSSKFGNRSPGVTPDYFAYRFVKICVTLLVDSHQKLSLSGSIFDRKIGSVFATCRHTLESMAGCPPMACRAWGAPSPRDVCSLLSRTKPLVDEYPAQADESPGRFLSLNTR